MSNFTHYFFSICFAICCLSACGGGKANLRIGVMPEGGSYQGVWQSPQYGNMHLCVIGSQVTGDFEKDERHGRIQGTIQGDVLRFQWDERREMVVGRTQITRGRGYFRLSIGDDEDQYLLGEWGHDDAEIGGGPWNAAKMRRRQPERCLRTSSSTDSSSSHIDGDEPWTDEESYDDPPETDSHTGESIDTDELEGLDEF